MKILRLLNPRMSFPSKGGFGFTDARTGKVYDGMSGTPEMIAPVIARDRRTNKHIYPLSEPEHFNITSIIQEMYQQLYARHPELFVGGHSSASTATSQAAAPAPTPSKACPACGSLDASPTYCVTCGQGNRLKGWVCLKCGKRRGI